MKPKKPKKTVSRQLIVATFVLAAIVLGGIVLLQALNTLTGTLTGVGAVR